MEICAQELKTTPEWWKIEVQERSSSKVGPSRVQRCNNIQSSKNNPPLFGSISSVFWSWFLGHVWNLPGARLLLERSWTSIFDNFGFVLNPKSMFWGPWIRLFKELFVVVSGCFLGTVHGGARGVPEKNCDSPPLYKHGFWCCLRMLLLAWSPCF